jgi:hypothetical protein
MRLTSDALPIDMFSSVKPAAADQGEGLVEFGAARANAA